jgi:hypothetical protein
LQASNHGKLAVVGENQLRKSETHLGAPLNAAWPALVCHHSQRPSMFWDHHAIVLDDGKRCFEIDPLPRR